jgi:hypothetical protein
MNELLLYGKIYKIPKRKKWKVAKVLAALDGKHLIPGCPLPHFGLLGKNGYRYETCSKGFSNHIYESSAGAYFIPCLNHEKEFSERSKIVS